MELKVEIISKEVIRPSSPTPAHLKALRRSLIDQIIGDNPVPVISFYPRKVQNFSTAEVLNRLKTSLSETLTLYYPLAGTVEDSSTVHCNDKGALVLTAQVNCRMEEILRHPNFEHFHKFGRSAKFYDFGDLQLSFQLNIFSCGGIAICCHFAHTITDATSMAAFLKCWAAISRTEVELAVCPEYKSGLLFPAKGSFPNNCGIMAEKLKLQEGKTGRRRRFVFSAAAISNLKTIAASDGISTPTRVEVVSGFIWKHAMAAAKVVCGVQQQSMLLQSADLRRRMVPTMPDYSAGNLIWYISAEYEATNSAQVAKLGELVQLLKDAKGKFGDEIVPELQNNGGCKVIYKSSEEFAEKFSNESLNLYFLVSWCKVGFHEVNFGCGLGKPIWSTMLGETELDLKEKNTIYLLDGEFGDEIEALISLDQKEMTVLESNEEFLAFASPNPGFTTSVGQNLPSNLGRQQC